MRARSPFVAVLLVCVLTVPVQAQTRMLDDFETFAGWRPIVSEGAKCSLSQAEGRTGKAMAIDFDLEGVYGYAIAEKNVELELPSNYQFSFEMKADIPVNNFEFKLMDEKDNVFWIKKLNIVYPKQWEKQKIKKRHITFAWGPSGGGELRRVRKLQIVVSSGQGGRGRILVDNLKFETLDDPESAAAAGNFSASSFARIPSGHTIDDKATVLTKWEGARRDTDVIEFAYNYLKEIGGLVIDWDTARYASAYTVELSEDGSEWTRAYAVTEGNGGRDYIYLPEKDARGLRLRFTRSAAGSSGGYAIARLEVKGPQFSLQPNNFFSAIAADSKPGLFPKFFLNRQSYWTVSGVNADVKEALINEEGMIEVDKEAFSLEPFLFIGGRLITWNDVQRTQSLEGGYLPIPSVEWSRGPGRLSVRLLSSGAAGASTAIATYRLTNSSADAVSGKLFIAIRPFQVNPPWQWLNSPGGFSPIRSIRADSTGAVRVDGRTIVPLTKPDGFGAVTFDAGEITEYLTRGILPERQEVTDQMGFASAALEYAFTIPAGAVREFHIAVPFHAWHGDPAPRMGDGGRAYVEHAFDETVMFWRQMLDRVRITLPAQAQEIITTVKSNLAYILINRDNAGIQPGSRNYERSWIRDGSLTSTALLELGVQREVREYIDWYANFQFPSGKIPCVVDTRGADPTAEHDSHGEFIYAIKTYFNFTHDTTWLGSKFDQVVKTVRFIQSLRAERKTDTYKHGTPEDRALYGLVPESISHEGYSDHPRHSYWDDFFTLRGLKDAADIARVLNEPALEKEFARERDDLRTDLYASMRLAMKNKNIDYIPGCAELGDFDATSTTIGITPAGELGKIPEPALHRTFDKYFSYFTQRRMDSLTWQNYTPYENRTIGSFVYLDQKERAQEAVKFFMRDRRPAAWNHWAEVVWRDRSTPKFIGDMPHTWVGSDFIRSVRSMFVYEREQDEAIVIGAGIPESWVSDTTGVTVEKLPTYYGPVSYTMRRTGASRVAIAISGDIKNMPRGRIVVKSPMNAPVRSARVNGKRVRAFTQKDITIGAMPAEIELTY